MQRMVMGVLTCYALAAVGCGSSSTAPPVVVAPASTPPVSTSPINESKFADKILGFWVAAMGKGENTPGETLEFTKDGKFFVSIPTDDVPFRLEGTYKLVDNKLTTTIKTPEGMERTESTTIKDVTDAKMVWLAPDGKSDVVFNRKK